MIPATTNGPSSGQIETTTYLLNIPYLAFDSITEEYAFFTITFPVSWDSGTVTVIFNWSHGATTTNYGVTWGIQAVGLTRGDPLDTNYGTAVLTIDGGGTTDVEYISDESSAITIGNTPSPDHTCIFRVYRDVGDGNDTLAIDARLEGVLLKYNTLKTRDD
jgi:hypothetical protein